MPRSSSLVLLLSIGCTAEMAELVDHPAPSTLQVQLAADGEWDDPDSMHGAALFTSIQTAIDAATAGDTVTVPSGTYVEDLLMKEGVIVDGAGQNETYLVGTVTFSGLSDATLSGMTLVDYTWLATGTAYSDDGILIDGGNATISDVGAFYFETAIFADTAGDVVIDDATLAYNWYGVYGEATTGLQVSNALVYSSGAGGIATNDGTSASIVHNTLISNGFSGTTAYLTGAISMGTGGTEIIANNILVSNYYGLNCLSCSSTWSHNLIWGNISDYVSDASAASTDVSEDPQFTNASEADFTLTETSGAVDSGSDVYTVATDADGEARPQGDGYDMGFDEYAASALELQITEVMANPSTESTGEFVEIYNAGLRQADLADLVLTDGDDVDTLTAFDGGATLLAPGEYAVVVDSDYASNYTIESDVTVVTTTDTNLGNGLTTSDGVTLYESDATTVISTFSHAKDPGDGVSLEMISLDNGDASGNWRASACDSGSSPGAAHCFPDSGDPAELIITEVMSNAYTERTGEYVEIYNPTETEIDLAGLTIADSGSSDTLVAYGGGSTLLGPGDHGLILDPNFEWDYYLPTDIVAVTT